MALLFDKTKVVFDTFDSNQEKVYFSKRATFNKVSDPRMLYLSKIGHGQITSFGVSTIKLNHTTHPAPVPPSLTLTSKCHQGK